MKHAIRMLLKRPAFSLVAILTLAIGIGANTAIFSVVDAVLLRPLPYPDPGRIVRIFERSANHPQNRVSNPNFQDWREQATSFSAMASFGAGEATIIGGREPVFADVAVVSKGFFQVMGVSPERGRTFVDEEMHVGGVPAVVVSHAFWEQTLGSPSDLSQSRVIVDGRTARVVGVMPPSFNYPAKVALWTPIELDADTSGRTSHSLSVIARLADGVSVTGAAAEMDAIAARLKQQYGNDDNAIGATTMPLRDVLSAGWQQQLLLLLGAVTLVLLIACANVATTLLARGEERRTELAVRTALGAGRGRLVRQLLIESVTVGVAGAVAGLLIAAWLVRVLTAVNPAALPAFASVGIDWRVLLFTLCLGVATPLLFGLIPALQASAGDVRDALAAGGRTGAAPVRGRIRAALVVIEVAVSLVLLVGATLLIRSFVNILDVDPGFDPRGVVTVHMAVPPTKYQTPERAAAFYAQLVERLRTVPGVASAGATNQVPLSGDDYGGAFVFEGHPDAGAQADNEYDGFRYSAGYRAVTPGYLEALAVHLEKGRFLRDSDTASQPAVAVVNEAFVRQFLPRTDPIGVRFKYAGMDQTNPYFTIVGVIKDIHHASLVKGSKPETYVSLYQAPFRAQWALTMLVRAASPAQAGAVAAAARETIRTIEPDTPAEISTLEHVLDDSIADRRFMLVVLAAFAAIALLLAASGIYSVLSQTVAQRTQEIGIRMALGAPPARVMRLMLGSAMLSVGLGVLAGGVAALVGMRVTAGLLFGVTPADPIALVAGAVLLVAVALLAAYVPARRATRIDPLIALRN